MDDHELSYFWGCYRRLVTLARLALYTTTLGLALIGLISLFT